MCSPAESPDVVKVAWPAESTVPSGLPSLVKVTLPLAVPAGVVTAAVKVTAWPSTARLAEEVTAVVVWIATNPTKDSVCLGKTLVAQRFTTDAHGAPPDPRHLTGQLMQQRAAATQYGPGSGRGESHRNSKEQSMVSFIAPRWLLIIVARHSINIHIPYTEFPVAVA